MTTTGSTVSVDVPARVHLAGNPSDGYGGAVLSATVPDLAATVAVTTSDRFSVRGPERSWRSIADLVVETGRHGHEGGDRLVTAALTRLDQALPHHVRRRPGHFRWTTSIPRSVGLGGSSAIVIATLRAALQWWGAEDALEPLALAEVALEAEVGGLGITAGLADRAVQVIGGVVLTDCRSTPPTVRRIDAPRGPSARIVWNEGAAAPSGVYHRELRTRFDQGDEHVLRIIDRLAALADRAAFAIAAGDGDALAQASNDSLRARCDLGAVPAAAMAPVDRLRSAGCAVNFAGSGGALVVIGDAPVPTGWESLALRLA